MTAIRLSWRQWAFVFAVLTGVLALGVVVGIAVAGAGHRYDEAAHRAAVEELLASQGRTVEDWDTLRDLAHETCDDTDTFGLNLQAAVYLDNGGADDLELMLLDIEHVCPDRLSEVTVTP